MTAPNRKFAGARERLQPRRCTHAFVMGREEITNSTPVCIFWSWGMGRYSININCKRPTHFSGFLA
jgi:hypothetical protein